MPIQVRRSGERAYFDYGWLKTFHTFSFGQYQDPAHQGFRSLRVINEDRVQPGVGFPLHGHQDMEIFSIVIEGGLAHQDDLGNGSILRPGRIQLMSAGTGVVHSETNASDKEEVHFLQVWILPKARNLKPSYQEKFFEPASQHNQWRLIISGEGREGSLHIHQEVSVYLATLEAGHTLDYQLNPERYGWLQIINGDLECNSVFLNAGDGAALSQEGSLLIKAETDAQLVFFDLI